VVLRVKSQSTRLSGPLSTEWRSPGSKRIARMIGIEVSAKRGIGLFATMIAGLLGTW
jgi:hypothetical protein